MQRIIHKLPTLARYGLGAGFLVFGLNGFFQFLPAPPPPPEAAMGFLGALVGTGYMFPLIKLTEVTAGVMLLSGLFVPLALSLLAPILVNIVAFHVFLAPAGIVLPLALGTAEIYLAWTYRAAFAPMLHARVAADATLQASSLRHPRAPMLDTAPAAHAQLAAGHPKHARGGQHVGQH